MVMMQHVTLYNIVSDLSFLEGFWAVGHKATEG